VLWQLENGVAVAFIRAGSCQWGIEISGEAVTLIAHEKPAQIEAYRGG
jgi:hypothetical protein